MGGLAVACVAIGLAPAVFWPSVARAVGAWEPAWSGTQPAAPLGSIGTFHVALATLCAAAAWGLWRMVRKQGLGRSLTWDCGFAAPSARMQYTAGSFAGTLTEWFAWILAPVKHGHSPEEIFPKKSAWEEHTPDTVLERVVQPASGAVMRLAMAARHVQHGTVQAYLLYLLVGLAALTAMVLAGGK